MVSYLAPVQETTVQKQCLGPLNLALLFRKSPSTWGLLYGGVSVSFLEATIALEFPDRNDHEGIISPVQKSTKPDGCLVRQHRDAMRE